MFMRRLFLLIILASLWMTVNAVEVKKWVDQNGKIHYGDIAGKAQQVEVIDVNDPVPEVTEGETLMRLKNELYFEQQALKRQKKQLAQRKVAIKKNKQQQKAAKKLQKKQDFNRRACIKARLKIEDIEDDLREGYSTKKGIQLEKKRKQQKRRVDAYC
jgi:hypothetical protein